MQRSNLTKTIGAKAGKRKKMALGKGLGALIPEVDTGTSEQKDFFFCDIDLIRPNRFQPRIRFSEEDLQELTDSIKAQGILQPLLVRKDENGYELIAGERRLRAAKRAHLSQVPVVIKRVNDDKMLEMAIVENIQRENLNPIEEAEAYHRLITQLNLTQDQASARVGKSRSAVANFLRLRQLPEQIKDSITDGSLSMGHARAILGAEASAQQLEAWRSVMAKGLSVRQTEALVRNLKSEKKKPRVSRNRTEEIYLSGLAEDLSRHFGTKIMIKKTGQKGKVEIEFYSNDDLERLIQRLKKAGKE
ncbi:MAG: ParB/RepB/Spo0J family partition protein [Deltaproteobacteria bacterium]|jgi:ParB family chromosome partitioning protein|nr:ParB/RepB/Spo0J family partition protein [Deltaproteobacteria bacterium]